MESTAKTLLRFAKGIKRYFAVAILAALVFIIFSFLSPQVIRVTVDSIIGNEPFDLPDAALRWIESLGGRDFFRANLGYCALGVILCAFFHAGFFFISRIANARFTESYVKNFRDTLYNHVQRLPFAWHTRNQTGDIIQRCTSDIDVIRNFLANQLIQVIRTLFIITTAVTLMLSMNLQLSLVALIFIPVVITYSFIFFRLISKKFRQADEAEGVLTVTVQENLTGVRVVRAFGRERFELERFDKHNEHFSNLWINMGYTMGAYWGIGDFVTGAQVLSVMFFGAILASQGHLTLGEYLTFITYNHMLAWPVRSLGRVLTEMSKTRVSVARLKEILDAEPEPEEPQAQKPDLRGDIVFENVTFAYTDYPILKNLSFTIPYGSVFGILGGTGSGKSTLTYLLNRLYDLKPDSGRITINGVDLRCIDRNYLRKNVGVVLQEPFLFSKTIEENIAITHPGASLDTVRRHAATAAVDSNIMSFGKGYDTMVGERGVTLSGGQKQRVAIARTLMTEAPIIIFDDSMSAVDLETDAQIRDSLTAREQEATMVLIAHRISTLMHANQIMVLENGEIAQLGTPRELMTQEGIYKRIYDMQSQAAQGNVPGGLGKE